MVFRDGDLRMINEGSPNSWSSDFVAPELVRLRQTTRKVEGNALPVPACRTLVTRATALSKVH